MKAKSQGQMDLETVSPSISLQPRRGRSGPWPGRGCKSRRTRRRDGLGSKWRSSNAVPAVGGAAKRAIAQENPGPNPWLARGEAQGAAPSSAASETLYAEYDKEDGSGYYCFVGTAEQALAATLISSPGYGVIDSGCGKTLIGSETLFAMEKMLGDRVVEKIKELNSFWFETELLKAPPSWPRSRRSVERMASSWRPS